MDQSSWMLVKSWAPFVVLMAIWLLIIRPPLMRRLMARFGRANNNKSKS